MNMVEGVLVINLVNEAGARAQGVFAKAKVALGLLIRRNGAFSVAALDQHQHAAHGVAWLATYLDAFKALAAYVTRLSSLGKLGEMEQLLVKIACGEYINQIMGGIPRNQTEIFPPTTLGLSPITPQPLPHSDFLPRRTTPATPTPPL